MTTAFYKIWHSTIVATLLLACSTVLAAPKIEITDSGVNGVYIVSVSDPDARATELLTLWLSAAKELCAGSTYRVEPKGHPVIREKRCSDAVKLVQNDLQCLEVDASVFGKVICEQAPPSASR
ncbi:MULTISPECIES: hypothetical protein [unclassified Pseudoalteromonas]|uniref:hypothetical protein n=1 Tax=unclassified Pseudoalteromonas TaxID=194690 RepID=UPI0020975903|nr:hypothetical protein [Pseudoalteromonas sp. XMcav2-N]MCO7187888.1 hypothetical protein [Pseudoalteromonas sp. XMcav2-N]